MPRYLESERMFRFCSISFSLVLLIASGFEPLTAQNAGAGASIRAALPTALPLPTYDLLRDTIFLLDSVYVEVRLDKQMIFVHFRSGRTKRFPCSTGNPRLKDAIATREGIFSIQWKSKRYMSRQFEVWLNYWMPFDGGIGFHGLDGRSYYKHLGRRPSSHGCVRISNETGRELFATAPRGTVVYVHSGAPARILAFAGPEENAMKIIGSGDLELLNQRLDAVRRGIADHPSLRERVVLPAGEKGILSIAVGRTGRSMRVQYRMQPARVSLIEPDFAIPEPPAPQILPPMTAPVVPISS